MSGVYVNELSVWEWYCGILDLIRWIIFVSRRLTRPFLRCAPGECALVNEFTWYHRRLSAYRLREAICEKAFLYDRWYDCLSIYKRCVIKPTPAALFAEHFTARIVEALHYFVSPQMHCFRSIPWHSDGTLLMDTDYQTPCLLGVRAALSILQLIIGLYRAFVGILLANLMGQEGTEI